jgi:hypothetical protein
MFTRPHWRGDYFADYPFPHGPGTAENNPAKISLQSRSVEGHIHAPGKGIAGSLFSALEKTYF